MGMWRGSIWGILRAWPSDQPFHVHPFSWKWGQSCFTKPKIISPLGQFVICVHTLFHQHPCLDRGTRWNEHRCSVHVLLTCIIRTMQRHVSFNLTAFEFLGLPWTVRSSASKAWEGRFRPRCLARIMKCKTVATTCDQSSDYRLCKGIRGVECDTVWNHGSGKRLCCCEAYSDGWTGLRMWRTVGMIWTAQTDILIYSVHCCQQCVETLTRTINRLHHQINLHPFESNRKGILLEETVFQYMKVCQCTFMHGIALCGKVRCGNHAGLYSATLVPGSSNQIPCVWIVYGSCSYLLPNGKCASLQDGASDFRQGYRKARRDTSFNSVIIELGDVGKNNMRSHEITA